MHYATSAWQSILYHALTHTLRKLKYLPAFVLTDVRDTRQQCDLMESDLTKQWQASPSDLLKRHTRLQTQ